MSTEQLSAVSVAYLSQMVNPIRELLAPVEDRETIVNWLNQISPEITQAVSNSFTEDLGADKEMIVGYLAQIVLLYTGLSQPTPWDLASNRNELTVKLFGEAQNTLPVDVKIGENTFTHQLSKEFTYGLVAGADETIQITLYGTPLTVDVFAHINDNLEQGTKYYVALVHGNKYIFTSIDFLQGVITSTQWRGVDPHTVVADIELIKENGEIERFNLKI